MQETTISDRVSLILSERHLKKAAFARTLGITPNYVYLITSGRVTRISDTLALLIEEKYGYCANWVLTGSGPGTPPGQAPPTDAGGGDLT